jgi:hypothetical protein
MLTAIILICSAVRTPDLADCTTNTAIDVMLTPVASAMPTTCFVEAEAFLAQMQVGRDLRDDERVRIICQPKKIQGTSAELSPSGP